MPFELWVALRYLRSTRSDAFVSLLSKITAGGLMLGVAALIVALAALSGFQDRLLGDILARSPLLQVELAPEADVEAIRADLEGMEGVRSVQLIVYGRGWLRYRSEIEPVEILGVESRLPPWIVVDSDVAIADEIWVSQSHTYRWGLTRGDVIEIASPRLTLTPRGPQPRSRRLRIAGAHDGGHADERYSQRVVMSEEQAASLVVPSDRRLDVVVSGRATADRLVSELEASGGLGPGARLVSWRDQNRTLLFVLRLEKAAIFLAVVLIVLVASFALVASLSLILVNKQAEVGILSAMGGAPRRLRRIFLALGGLFAAIGTVGGAVIGVGLSWLFGRFELIPLPGDVYIVDHVPFAVRWVDVVVVLGATVVVTAIASFVGARKVGTLDPVAALHR